ncbi:site-2 protease family protein, partial [Clostridium botulinum]|nr:site-2 protease family protein [Clostridium botulinum]
FQMLILLGLIFFGGFIISVPVNFLYGKAIKLASIVFTMF